MADLPPGGRTDPVLRRLGELGALRDFLSRAALATPQARAYADARACAEYDRSRKLAREVRELRKACERTAEHRAAEGADRDYQAFVAANRAGLEADVRPLADLTWEQWHEQHRELEREAERTAPPVPDPSQPVPWDHQLALDDMQAFEVLYPEPEAGAEPG